jgi:hypothetical protein
MLIELNDYLVGIAIGIRFRANFSIEDQLGKIVDDILYKKNSSFGPAIFPNVQSRVGQKRLINEKTLDYLTIDNSNFILELNASESIAATDMPRYIKAFEAEVIRGVMRSYGVKEIRRIGYIRKYIFTLETLASRFVDKTIGGSLEGVEDINLSFSKKMPNYDAQAMRDVNDYNNVIFNIIKHADKSEIFMSVDYQRVYVPFLQSVKGILYDQFISSAEAFNNKNYLTWLNKNYVEA